MKTYKTQANEKLQARIKLLKQTIDTARRLNLAINVDDLLRQHAVLVRESVLRTTTNTQLKKARRKFSS